MIPEYHEEPLQYYHDLLNLTFYPTVENDEIWSFNNKYALIERWGCGELRDSFDL